MKTRLVFTVFALFTIATIWSQERTLVFNKEGKIVKNYGFNAPEENGVDIKIIIEGVTDAEMKNYFLLYEWRNEYNYEANTITTLKKSKLQWFLGDGLSLRDTIISKDKRFLNYKLIKVNSKGKALIKANLNLAKNLATLLKLYKPILETTIKTYVKANYDDLGAFIKKQNIVNDSVSTNKKRLANYKKKKHLFYDKKNGLTAQITAKEKVLEQLSKITHASTTPDLIISLGKEIYDLKGELFEVSKKITKIETYASETLKLYTKKKESLKKEIISKITKNPTTNSFLKEPIYKVLHQGVLIAKEKNVHEIVYDIHNNSALDSNHKQLEIGRITPNLPQLTTASQLYAHVINFTPTDLINNPFKITMKASHNDSVSVESTSNFKGIEAIDSTSSDLIGSVFGGVKSLFSDDNEAEEVEEEDTEDVQVNLEKTIEKNKVIILNKLSWLKNGGMKGGHSLKVFFNDFDDNGNISLQGEVINYYKEMNLLLIKKYTNLLKDEKVIFDANSSNLTFGFKPFYEKLISKVKESNRITNETIYTNKIKTLVTFKVKEISNYTEFIVKYPIPFKANSAPTINLYVNQLKIENYVKKVEEGKVKKPSYNVAYKQILMISDVLPPTHRLFRFALTSGVLYTTSTAYEVDINNNTVSVDDSGFRPSVTFSTYFNKQDLNVDNLSSWNTVHFDVSLDYKDANILDNVYLGLGIEPFRNFHIGTGFRLGKTDKTINNKIERVSNSGVYLSASLGFNLIPSVIKTLF